MMYEVHTGDEAHEAIRRAARFIAIDQRAPENCKRWLETLWDRIDSLEEMPYRFIVDPIQSKRAGREIRKMIFGDYLIFYTVDEDSRRVDIVGFRHGARGNNA